MADVVVELTPLRQFAIAIRAALLVLGLGTTVVSQAIWIFCAVCQYIALLDCRASITYQANEGTCAQKKDGKIASTDV